MKGRMPEVTVDSLSGHRVSTEILQEILWDYCAENLTHEKQIIKKRR